MKSDDVQQRKELPRRASRGVRTQQTTQQKQQDDRVYKNLFGDLDSSSESDSSFSQQVGLRPMQTFSANFANYNYGRGYHYFFNLNTFPRVQASPSYALDNNNRFNFTYSHDQQSINGTKLKKIINRHYIGLPTIETTLGNSKNKDKNVCHYHLFNNQDKKYYNHRLISKYKYVLEHLENLGKSGKLQQYTELKKDVFMHEVCLSQTSLQKKRQILQNRIKVLEERVFNMITHWDWEDHIYFHFSLDQLFHNQSHNKGQDLSIRGLKQRIFSRILSRKQFIESSEEGAVTLGAYKPKIAVQNWLTFEFERARSAITSQTQNILKNSIKLIEMFKRKEELISFPLFLFDLGNAEKAVDRLMKAKLENQHESAFYIYKAFIKKLFKRDLLVQQQYLAEPILSQDFSLIMKKKLAKIEQFYQNKSQQKTQHFICTIDQIVDIDKIQNSPIQNHIVLLNSEHRIQINLKELMLLFFYRNISQAMTEFVDFINFDPEILKLMADKNYEKYHYGIAKVLHQHQFCILLNDIQRIADILNTFDIAPEFDQNLFFSFNKNLRVGYIWAEKESDQWETEKDDEEQQDDNSSQRREEFEDEDLAPSKKVKSY